MFDICEYIFPQLSPFKIIKKKTKNKTSRYDKCRAHSFFFFLHNSCKLVENSSAEISYLGIGVFSRQLDAR